jgi:hypothetical protein
LDSMAGVHGSAAGVARSIGWFKHRAGVSILAKTTVMPRLPSHFLWADHKVNHAVRRGDKEAIEIFPQLLDFIATLDAMNF